MANNWLVTGPPGSGKSTVLERTADRLESRGYVVRGLVSPEVRSLGHRVGFEIVDLAGDEQGTLAHVDRDEGPAVGKYRVDVDAVDRVSEQAIGEAARRAADAILVDEIAPMETFSDVFVDETRACLDAELPVIGSVHRRSTSGFVGEVKDRDDVEVLEVTKQTRDGLPDELVERVLARLADQA